MNCSVPGEEVLLSNFEVCVNLLIANFTKLICFMFEFSQVLQILKESQASGGGKNRKDPLATIRYEVWIIIALGKLIFTKIETFVCLQTLEYFKRSPCSVQTEESLKSLVAALKPFKLTNKEFLSILNSRPTAPADLAPVRVAF
jgi:hypothetical protein